MGMKSIEKSQKGSEDTCLESLMGLALGQEGRTALKTVVRLPPRS